MVPVENDGAIPSTTGPASLGAVSPHGQGLLRLAVENVQPVLVEFEPDRFIGRNRDVGFDADHYFLAAEVDLEVGDVARRLHRVHGPGHRARRRRAVNAEGRMACPHDDLTGTGAPGPL